MKLVKSCSRTLTERPIRTTFRRPEGFFSEWKISRYRAERESPVRALTLANLCRVGGSEVSMK